MPTRNNPMASSEVPTGRRMNGSEMFMDEWFCRHSCVPADAARRPRHASHPCSEAIQVKINDRRRVERQELREQQAADDGDAQRLAQFRASAVFQGQRQRAEQRRQGGHHDRPKPQQTRLIDGFFRRQTFVALGVEREVDHHDRVLLHDADEQDDADERDQRKIVAENISASSAPTPAEGRLERIVMG